MEIVCLDLEGVLVPEIWIEFSKNTGIEELKEGLADLAKGSKKQVRFVADLIKPHDTVVLVIPIDTSAPKGRLILPQQEAIRDILDAGGISLVTGVENLPNTIAEAMSCGTPCVGFEVGGIPEMIDHLENGYVARYRDAADLAAGIRFVLRHNLRADAHSKAADAYGETHVAQEYIKLYSLSLSSP